MIRSRLAAIGWGGRESLPSLRSWILGLVLGGLGLVLFTLLLAVIPYGPWFSSERPPHPTGNTIVEFFLTSPFHLALVLVPAALSIWIGRLDRKREDRYDRLALLAVVLAALGMATAFAGAKPTWLHLGEWRPFGLVALSVASFAASAALSLISLGVLLFTRSPRRGRAFALFTLVWSAWFGGFQYAFLLVPRDPPPELLGGIELPLVSEGILVSYWSLTTPQEWREVLRISADGEIEWESESIANVSSPDGDAELRRLLAKIAAGMPVEEGRPDGALFLRADRRAPAGVPARILSLCGDEDVGIWKVCVEVELDRVQEGLPNWGRICTYLPRSAPVVISGAVEIHAAEDAAGAVHPLFRYEGEEFREASELVAQLLERDRSSLERHRTSDVPLVRVDPRLPWGTVATTLSELLLLEDWGNSDPMLELTGMEVLEH